jgi:predicted nucleotidyltransferase
MSIGNVDNQLARKLPLDKIAETCRKYDVVELSIFGSVLREDFGPESDIDFMAVIRNDDYGPWMSKVQQLENALSELVGREVDVVTKESVLQSENWIRKNHILETAQVIYGS